jgi:hypothetical protein
LLVFCADVSALAAIVLVYVPAVPLDTLTVIVQLPLAGIVPLVSAAEPALADKDPLHVFAAAGEVAMLRPLGSVSVRAIWVRANAFVLLRVIVSVELEFVLTLVGAKVSLIVGATGVVTVSVAVAVAVLPPAGPVVSAFAAMLLV